MRHWLWDDRVIPLETVDDVIAESRARFAERGFGHWALREAAQGPLLGTSGVTQPADGRFVELLYALHPEHQGRGLATEATRAVLAHLFAHCGLEEVFARADVPNAASVRVMERLGMRFVSEGQEGGLRLVTWAVTRRAFEGSAELRGEASDQRPWRRS